MADQSFLALIERQLIESLQVINKPNVIGLRAIGTPVLEVIAVIGIDAVVCLGEELRAHRATPSKVGINGDPSPLACGQRSDRGVVVSATESSTHLHTRRLLLTDQTVIERTCVYARADSSLADVAPHAIERLRG